MKYVDIIREYCAKNRGELLDVSYVNKNEFADIPYKTLLKTLNRIEEEGIIKSVAKGLYYIGKGAITENKVVAQFTENGRGMIIGYTLFSDLGLTDYNSGTIDIYTNGITSQSKRIGKIYLRRADVVFMMK